MTTKEILGWTVTGIVALAGFIWWTSWHDTQVMIAAELYENCIRVEYGVSPAQYRAEHGEYPVCVPVEK